MPDINQKIVDSLPTDVLLREAKKRKQDLRDKMGPYAIHKRFTECPACSKKDMGKRELIRHKLECIQWAELKEQRKNARRKKVA